MPELATRPAPVTGAERILALDVLRGFAVLGILVMNVQSFAMPFAAYSNPTHWGEPGLLGYWLWGFAALFAEQKFMTIFSLLFGAGVALMLERLEERGAKVARVHYRRAVGLMLIGAAHAYLLWYGDILFTYGACALLLYFFRRVRPTRLLIIGIAALCISPLVGQGFQLALPHMPPETREQIMSGMSPSDEMIAAEAEIYRGGWWQQMQHRVPTSIMLETVVLLMFTLWRAGGLMLIGMALYKWGVVTAARPPTFYRRLAVVGFCLGFPLAGAALWWNLRHGFSFEATWFSNGVLNYVGSLGVSLGYIACVMLWCLSRRPGTGTRALGAVGRMALTNYLLQTILCTLIFYGHGLGLFGHVDRAQQWLVVLAVWAFQLAVSPWWLARFRFGPFEWLWRSMTYLRPQPMRK